MVLMQEGNIRNLRSENLSAIRMKVYECKWSWIDDSEVNDGPIIWLVLKEVVGQMIIAGNRGENCSKFIWSDDSSLKKSNGINAVWSGSDLPLDNFDQRKLTYCTHNSVMAAEAYVCKLETFSNRVKSRENPDHKRWKDSKGDRNFRKCGKFIRTTTMIFVLFRKIIRLLMHREIRTFKLKLVWFGTKCIRFQYDISSGKSWYYEKPECVNF